MKTGLSIVLPTYDSSELIAAPLSHLTGIARYFDPIELIIVDDGSGGDFLGSVSRCSEVASEIRLLRNRGNLGKGTSIVLGFHAARHSKVLFTDADIPFDRDSYSHVAEALSLGAPAVVGCRRRHESQLLVHFDALSHAAQRHFVGIVFNRMVRALTGLSYSDTQCGLKAFDRELVLSLFRHVRYPRFVFDIELLLAARYRGVRIEEVPVCVIYEDLRSTVRVGAEAWRMGRDLIGVWRLLRRGAYREEPEKSLLDGVRELTQEVSLGAPSSARPT